MSWSIKTAGTKEAVKRVIEAEKYMPDEIKLLIATRVDKMELPSTDSPYKYGVLVESSGHFDASYSNCQMNISYCVIDFLLPM